MQLYRRCGGGRGRSGCHPGLWQQRLAGGPTATSCLHAASTLLLPVTPRRFTAFQPSIYEHPDSHTPNPHTAEPERIVPSSSSSLVHTPSVKMMHPRPRTPGFTPPPHSHRRARR
eukprot:17247-Chlamydomonas_euryale.AAC.1